MRVLVTRPEPGTAATAARLAAMGHEPVQLPLTQVCPLPIAADAIPAEPDAIALTSANALRHLPQDIARRLAAVPLFAVGKATAAAARRLGFVRVEEGGGNAAALAACLAAARGPGSSILYLCGRVRLPDFERRLAEAGMAVAHIETYDTLPVAREPEALEAAIGARPIDAILLHSAASAEVLSPLLTLLAPRLSPGVVFACLSVRVAAALGRNPGGKVRVAAEPTETALFSELSL